MTAPPLSPARRGAWPALAAFAALFLLGFFALRARAPFARAEAEAAALAPQAAAHGVALASALALRAQAIDLDADAFTARLRRFAAWSPELGEPLAAVALAAGEPAARALLATADPSVDPAAAWPRLRARPEAIAGVEFELLQQRFAARRSGRTR
ncbi:MAG: hypothetical protein AB7O97_19105 [Planctomycetota bacterium]